LKTRLTIRVSKEEKLLIEKLAKQAEATISDFCLSKILELKLTDTKPVEYVTKIYVPKRKKKLKRD